MRSTLHEIIRGHTRRSYTQLWTDFYHTDRKPGTEFVWDIYTDIPAPGTPVYTFTFFEDQCVYTGAEGSCYNREHSFPTSWWGGGTTAADTMYTDLFHIYPVDGNVNSTRNNWPYGEVAWPTKITSNGSRFGPNTYSFEGAYTGNAFEPIDAYKGDLARTYFYMLTRYKSRIASWDGNTEMLEGDGFAPWALDMLLKWHEDDPVSQKEIDRNNAVYGIQGNRNPFIDHPEFVDQIWGDGFGPEPTNHVADFSANTITLSWNAASGDYTPDGYLVRMSDQGFEHINDPVNGTPVADGFWDKTVGDGKLSVSFGGLSPETVYYFKVFSFTNSGAYILYKTGESVPQISLMAK